MQYPPQLSYNNINPKGFFSTFKQWIIQPIATGGSFWPGQNIRILIQSVISGVMDPYRSHIQLEVQCDSQTLPVGLLQVDSSAQSFIQQLVISSKNRQLQRIPQYGVLAAWLTDIGLAQMYAQGRQTEGLGFSNNQSSSYNTSAFVGYATSTSSNGTVQRGMHTSSGGFGTIQPTMSPVFNSINGMGSNLSFQDVPYAILSKSSNRHIQPKNVSWLQNVVQTNAFRGVTGGASGDSSAKLSTKYYGFGTNLRAQYVNSIHSTKYVDSTKSIPSYQIRLKPQVLGANGVNALWQTGLQYNAFNPSHIDYFHQTTSTSQYSKKLPNTTSLNGYTSLFSPTFSKGVNQPFISPTVPQCQMMNGKILPQKIPITKRTFKIPIISAILGVLIPQDQFVLLPIKALNQILIQIVVDRYAMFTSGYNDIAEFDQNGIKLQQLRAYNIRKFNYHMHTYQFYSPQIDQHLNKALLNRIVLNVNMWTLGNQYTVQKGDNINNSWPVACTSQALNQIVVLFVPHDYQHYTFCRKHFRISNNITKFQLRVNMDYYPSQPILGNGGNPCLIQNLDNSNFLQSIFWSNNFMFNKVNPNPRINAYNFAINDRCYNIANKNTYYDPLIINDSNYNWNQNSVNSDTALGMPHIHQNRFVGKAGYVFSFQPYAHSPYHLTGMDCRSIRQFDVLLTTNPSDTFQRQQTLYIYTRSSVIVQFTTTGVNVYGR